jgi:outer membrane protein insertion porin family
MGRTGGLLAAAVLAALGWLAPGPAAQAADVARDGATDPAIDAAIDATDAPVRAASVDWGPEPPLGLARLEEVTGIAPGAEVSPQILAQAVRTLIDLPQIRWAAVRTEPAGAEGEVAVHFRLEATTRLGRLIVTGARAMTGDEVERVARMRPGDEVDPPELVQVRDRILAAYARIGFFAAQVDAAAMPPDPGAAQGQVNVRVAVREGSRGKVAELRYPGLPEPLPRRLFRPVVRTRVGGAFDAETLQADMARIERYLSEKGYLNPQVGPYELAVAGTRVSVTIPVYASDRFELDVRGDPGMSDAAVRRVLNLTSHRTLDTPVLDEARQRLLTDLREKGYRDAEVTIESVKDPQAPLYRVTVTASHGPRHRTAEVRFSGNIAISADELRSLVRPGFHLLAEPVREAAIEERAARVEGTYRAAGYPAAAVTYSITPVRPGDHHDVVTYIVEEGPRWWVDHVAVEGLDGVVPEAAREARKAADALAGEPFRRDRLLAARGEVNAALAERGYADADVETRTETREVWRGKVGPGGVPLREVIADLTFQARPGPQVHVGEVHIEGTFRTRPSVVAREVTIRPGGLYTPGSLAETRRNLFRAAAFDRVQVGPTNPDDHGPVRDVTVHLTEGKPGAVELGAGYAEKDGVRGLIDLSYRDLFRRGHEAGLRLRYGQLNRSATLRYVLPYIGPFHVPLHSRLLYEQEDLISYDRRTWAAEVGIRRPLMPNVTLTVTYRLERNRFPRLPADQVASLPERRRINVGSIFGSIVRDTRNDPFSPDRGTILGATYEQGAHVLLSEVQFAKATFQAADFIPLGRGLVLAARAQTGRVRRLFASPEVPVSERFFLGGQSSIRGYTLDSVGVPGETLVTGVPQGGLIMILTSLELRLGSEKGWGMVVFADAGNVWDAADHIGVNDMRLGAGPGLRFGTPVGPLRLDLGYKIDRQPGEDPWRLHFTLGNSF